MQTVQTKVYSYSELSEAAKMRALEKFRHVNVEFEDWEEGIKEAATEKLAERGYRDIKIMYTGFGSQGDGACFTATLDLEKWLQATGRAEEFAALKSLDSLEDVTVTLSHSWRYYFATSTTVDVELVNEEKSSPEVLEALDRLEKAISEDREKLGDGIYHDLEMSYFELIEDEAVAETIEANDWQFTENGAYFPV